MSKSYEEIITCPGCKKQFPSKIWEIINTEDDPEMKTHVMSVSAFSEHCPNCFSRIYLDYEFLYHQPNGWRMIAYTSNEDKFEIYNQMLEEQHRFWTMQAPVFDKIYVWRIVRSLNAFKEKIFIFDDELDDRIIELYKFSLYKKYFGESYDDESNEIFYLGIDEPVFEIQKNGRRLTTHTFDNEYYDYLKQHYEKLLPKFRGRLTLDIPIIDRVFAECWIDEEYI